MPSHLTTSQRFWAKVDKTGPVPDYAPHLGNCWLWTAGCVRGYGRFTLPPRKNVPAHVWAYEQEHGPIPRHLEPDHLCRVRRCIRPSHIEIVSNRINVLRGDGPTAKNARKTHCLNGHAFDRQNTYCKPSGGRNASSAKGNFSVSGQPAVKEGQRDVTIHWAPDDFDVTETACGKLVGYVFTETEDEVTHTKGEADCKACREELDDEEPAP